MPDQLPEIELEDRGSKGRYVLRGPGGAEAEMTFTKIGEHQIIIDHTEVPDAFRGQGAGLRRWSCGLLVSSSMSRCLIWILNYVSKCDRKSAGSAGSSS